MLSLVFGLYGALIVLGECSLVFSKEVHKYFSPLGYILDAYKDSIITFLITVPSLCMFILYAYYGLFNFRLSKFYGLFPHHQTDPSCLVYSALYVTKLAFPICYNYLLLVTLPKTATSTLTNFESALGIIDMVPYLGKDFQHYFPCIIFLFLVLNIFEVYSIIPFYPNLI